jgi:hypothetical protein
MSLLGKRVLNWTFVVALVTAVPTGGLGLGGSPAVAKPDGGGRGAGQGGGRGAGPGQAARADDRGGRGSQGGKPLGDGLGAQVIPGLGRLVERLAGQGHDAARARYAQALGRDGPRGSGVDRDLDVVVELTPELTADLLRRDWRRHERLDGGWRNHGERVRTLVELAKALGYSASVGALQANFGTPFENGLQPAPSGDWSVIDLDVNDDGRVDMLDLAELEAPAEAPSEPPPSDEGDAGTDAGLDGSDEEAQP